MVYFSGLTGTETNQLNHGIPKAEICWQQIQGSTEKTCASEEKVQYTKKKSLGPELDGYRLTDVQNLLNFVSVLPCPNCGGNGYTINEDIDGLRSSLSFKCLKPDCGNKLNSQLGQILVFVHAVVAVAGFLCCFRLSCLYTLYWL